MRSPSLRRRARKLGVAIALLCGLVQGANATEEKIGGNAPTPTVRVSDIKGQYTLAGGRSLTIFGSEYSVHVQLDGHPEVRMVRAGPALFRAADGSFTLTFRPHANGIVLEVDLEETRAPERVAPR